MYTVYPPGVEAHKLFRCVHGHIASRPLAVLWCCETINRYLPLAATDQPHKVPVARNSSRANPGRLRERLVGEKHQPARHTIQYTPHIIDTQLVGVIQHIVDSRLIVM